MDSELSDLSTLTPLLSSPRSSISDLSTLSRSPEPPPGWREFTPPPSQDAGDDLPPARKRRKTEHKTRTTQHIDLTSDSAQAEYDRTQAIGELIKALRKRRKIVIVAGAGISVTAGIPDFRSSHGLFKTLPGTHKLKGSGKQLFDASVYKDDSSTSHFHDMVRQLSDMSAKAKPTRFHRLIARLSTEGRLLRLYTQNVDGLDTSLPPLATTVPLAHKGPWPQTIQLHGGLEKMTCQKCRHISDFDPTLFQGPRPPPCPLCVAEDDARTNVAGKRSHGIGRLRPRIVLYNEHNPDDEAIGAVSAADMRTRPDAVVVVGTSMKIPGVRRIVSQMCKIVRDRREGTTIWINRDGVPAGKDLEDCWDLIVKGDSDDVARLVNLKDWDDPSESVEEYTDSDVERVKAAQGQLKVVLPPSPSKKSAADFAMQKALGTFLTPPRSNNGDTEHNKTPKPAPGPAKLKLFLGTQEGKNEVGKIKNPASHYGRKLGDVLGKENEGKPMKSKTSLNRKPRTYKKKPRETDTQAHITGKISKSVSKPMVQVPSKKDPLSPSTDFVINAVKADPYIPFARTEVSPTTTSPPSQSWSPGWQSDQVTISPKGNIPPDMVRLLN